MVKTKIEWCDHTVNFCQGCLHTCNFCYARKMAKRFANVTAMKEWHHTGGASCHLSHAEFIRLRDDLYTFKPVWLQSNYDRKLPKKPSRIFVNSMSDIAFWKSEWTEKVMQKIEAYPQHVFLFLTKAPLIYITEPFIKAPANIWRGVTVNTQKQLLDLPVEYLFTRHKFVSIEPIQDDIALDLSIKSYLIDFPWVIVGAETGNRKGKITPQPAWIRNLYDYTRKTGQNLFFKNSLEKLCIENGIPFVQESPNFWM